MARPGLKFNADLTDAFAAMGALTGITQTLKSQQYLGEIIKFTHNEMAREFDNQLHLKAGMMRKRFHHVYEWGMVGVPEGKLWQHNLSGRGSERVAGFTFLPSKKPILSPEERATNPDDPMSNVPPVERAKLSKRRYVYHWKAPLMEYRMNVTIAPKNGKFLFIPTFRNDKGFIFYPGSVTMRAGSEQTAGAFTADWVSFMSGPGQQIAGERVRQSVETETQQAADKWTKRPKNKSFIIKAAASNEAAFQAGRNMAKEFLMRRAEEHGSEL